MGYRSSSLEYPRQGTHDGNPSSTKSSTDLPERLERTSVENKSVETSTRQREWSNEGTSSVACTRWETDIPVAAIYRSYYQQAVESFLKPFLFASKGSSLL